MSWKVVRANTEWSAEQASTVLSFHDDLRDELWHSHSEQITALRLVELDAQQADSAQRSLDLDEHIDF